MEDGGGRSSSYENSLRIQMENPFSLKVGQVFTGFGVGCGIGIGVGRPIYLGAIPVLQQVLSSTRGATDAFSGVGRHVNSSLQKLGMKKIEAGIGCGIGLGHGFGVGLALKPGVVHRIQYSLGQVMERIMLSFGNVPGVSSVQSVMPALSGSAQNSVTMLSGTSSGSALLSTDGLAVLKSKSSGSTSTYSSNEERFNQEAVHDSLESKAILSEKSVGNRTKKVINNFLQDLRDDNMEVDQMAGNLRTENNVLQILLKHQQIIEELLEENQKLRQILVEDLKVPPSKLQANNLSNLKVYYPCSDCFECRRRKRKASR